MNHLNLFGLHMHMKFQDDIFYMKNITWTGTYSGTLGQNRTVGIVFTNAGAGPFTAGTPGSNEEKATPNLHRLLSPEAARGRLWNPKKRPEENRRVFSEEARAELQEMELELGNTLELPTPKASRAKLENQSVNSQCMFFCNPFCRVGCHVARWRPAR